MLNQFVDIVADYDQKLDTQNMLTKGDYKNLPAKLALKKEPAAPCTMQLVCLPVDGKTVILNHVSFGSTKVQACVVCEDRDGVRGAQQGWWSNFQLNARQGGGFPSSLLVVCSEERVQGRVDDGRAAEGGIRFHPHICPEVKQ